MICDWIVWIYLLTVIGFAVGLICIVTILKRKLIDETTKTSSLQCRVGPGGEGVVARSKEYADNKGWFSKG